MPATFRLSSFDMLVHDRYLQTAHDTRIKRRHGQLNSSDVRRTPRCVAVCSVGCLAAIDERRPTTESLIRQRLRHQRYQRVHKVQVSQDFTT
jgi:hypothetical protein